MTENKQVYRYKANGLTATVVILKEATARINVGWVKVWTAFGGHWVEERELTPVTDGFTGVIP